MFTFGCAFVLTLNKRFYLAGGILMLFSLVVSFMNPMTLLLLGVAPLLWVGVPAVMIGGFYSLFLPRTSDFRRQFRTFLRGVAAFACFVGVAIPANRVVQNWSVDAARAYPAQVAPHLEAYRQLHGRYPATLDQLSTKPPVPRLLRRSHGYRSTGPMYWFHYSQPGTMMDHWEYDSETQSWRLFT
jgi:hypothetical protein